MRTGTFSIAARCERTGQLGVATSTAALAGGAFVPFARPGVGAVATQAFTNPYLAGPILDRLAAGEAPTEALAAVISGDDGRDERQVLVVDAAGRTAAFTGPMTTEWAGHETGASFVVGGNTLAGPGVIPAMADAFREGLDEPLGERLVRALEAGQAAGGDRRGRQSAAMYIVWREDYGHADLRVDDHPDPVSEMRRLWQRFRVELEPYLHFFPTKARPSGVLNRAARSAAQREADRGPTGQVPQAEP